MIRPVITALIEYFLCYVVFTRGKKHKSIIALVLFFLATYQLGEVVIFLTQGSEIGFKIAYVATTMLPPLGVLLAEKILKKKLGYPIFQLIALFFIYIILIIPQVALKFEFGPFCIRIFEYSPLIAGYWPLFYQLTLMFTMGALVWGMLRSKLPGVKTISRQVLIGYLLFDGLTFIITYFFPWFIPSTASLMCALALLSSFIFTRMSLANNLQKLPGFNPRRWRFAH